MTTTLFPLPTLSPPTVLTQAKAAFSFTIHSFTQHIDAEGKPSQPDVKTIPTLITYLVVGCRRKVVIYTWKDGEAQEVKVRNTRFWSNYTLTVSTLGSSVSAFSQSHVIHDQRMHLLCIFPNRICRLQHVLYDSCRCHDADNYIHHGVWYGCIFWSHGVYDPWSWSKSETICRTN